MLPDSVAARIQQFNLGRRADVLAPKYAKLRKSPWNFFRGTGHLLYASAALRGGGGADRLQSGRHWNLGGKLCPPAAPAGRAQVAAWLADFARQTPAAGVRGVLDVARLAAGTSSLGLARYAVLLDGQGAG